MTINQNEEEMNTITTRHDQLDGPLNGKMLWQGDQSSKFFTPDPERESVRQDMSSHKNKPKAIKPMSFIDKNGGVTEGINFGQ